MSDRLDLVRLIDVKVTSTRRTATRSKQLAEAARDALHVHEDWIKQHREQCEGDLKRHQRRMKRQERIENNKRFAVSALLFLPRLCAWLYRGVVSSLRAVDDAFFSGCVWIARTVYALGRSLIGLLSQGFSLAGSKALSAALMLVAAVSILVSWLGKSAHIGTVALIGASMRGLSWLGPRASHYGQRLVASLSQHLSRTAASASGLGHELGSGAKQQASQLVTRLRSRPKLPQPKPSPTLNPAPLQQAAFIRLRAEHERLQVRIHAMDRSYQQRRADPRHAQAKDWVELRRLAVNAQRLYDVQHQRVLANGALPPRQAGPVHQPVPSAPLLRAGHIIYKAPAMIAGASRRRAGPQT